MVGGLRGLSAKKLADGLARAELERPAGERGDVFLEGVEAEGLEDGGMDVLDGGGPSGILGPLGIGRADHLAATQAAAGKGQAEAGGPVVAAAEGVDLRRPAELAAAENDRPDNSVSVHHYCFPWDNLVSVHHYCFPCIKSVSWIHGKTSKTDRR